MPVSCEEQFERRYEAHLKHLRLKGLQPKAIEADARAVRTVGAYFRSATACSSSPSTASDCASARVWR
ncbi:hypothetical protein [Thiocapsa sp.]|uniref:hypothetical protein n=1 Tax=Thiocapsa sp. TaxID=2024551 RepID=UPI003594076B